MTITTNLKYIWRVKHGKSNAIIRDFGDATGAIDFKDDELKLTETNTIDPKSIKAMTTGLKRALCQQVIETLKVEPLLRRNLAQVAWKVDVYKLAILSVEVSK
jgi:hypothetical protein